MTPLHRANANVARGSRQLAGLVARWLMRYGAACMEVEKAKARGTVAKSTSTAEQRRLEAELAALIRRFGIRQAAASHARSVIEADPLAGSGAAVPGRLVNDAIAGKKTKIKWFWSYQNDVIARVHDISEKSKDAVRSSVRRIITDAQDEKRADGTKVVPSMGEIARRIHTQWHTGEDGKVYAFSPERAALIAQTELGQAENLGIYEGYRETGVEEIEWLSRIGSIRHGSLSGKRVKIGEKFTASNGDTLKHPGDMSAPIRSTINCRCTTVPVISAELKAENAPVKADPMKPAKPAPVKRPPRKGRDVERLQAGMTGLTQAQIDYGAALDAMRALQPDPKVHNKRSKIAEEKGLEICDVCGRGSTNLTQVQGVMAGPECVKTLRAEIARRAAKS